MKILVLILLLVATPVTALATSNPPFLRCFEIASKQHDVPLPVLLGVAKVESSFNPDARSNANAHGIMQVQWPGTARHLGIRRVADLYNPCVNIDAGASYLAELIKRFSDLELALAAYNYGPSRLRSKTDVPISVRRYVKRVLEYQMVTQHETASAAVIELNAFRNRHMAVAYVSSLKGFDQDLQLRIKKTGHSHSVLLDTRPLTQLQRMRLSRIIPLEEYR